MFKMYIMNRHYNNRAVSEIIAALLLIAIAVAAAVLLYVFSIGLLGSLGSSGGQQTKEQVIMEAYSFPISGPLVLTVRNVGSSSENLAGADYFVNGVKQPIPTITLCIQFRCYSRWLVSSIDCRDVYKPDVWCCVPVEDSHSNRRSLLVLDNLRRRWLEQNSIWRLSLIFYFLFIFPCHIAFSVHSNGF